MRKTEHHTIEGNRKTKNSIKRLFFCLLAIFLQIAFFLSIMNHLNTQMPWINALTKILVLILVLYIYSIPENALDHTDSCHAGARCLSVSDVSDKQRNPQYAQALSGNRCHFAAMPAAQS